MVTRQEKILSGITPSTQLGLEIGALNKPIVTREMGNVRYVDHASTEALKQKYASDPNVAVEEIVDINYVWGTQTLPELVSKEAPFDYVIASHVIEHVPDLIGWLKEIHAVLKPGGILALAIPDKRRCFDFYRPLTQARETLEAYLQKQRQPSFGQIFEFHSLLSAWRGQFVWAESAVGHEDEVIRVHNAAEAWQITNQIVAKGEYYDVHCWVFTPQSFFELIKTLIQFELFPFQVKEFYDTEGCEFFVSLTAVDLTKDPVEQQSIQLASLPTVKDASSALERLQQVQADLTQTKSQLQEIRATRKRLKAKVAGLQTRLADSEAELSAIQSSKFWKLRGQWMRLKKLLGH
jgi:2-polyprenyl-3-methyl-5-hydroxy-6-metoxy-1,4-benzoquinol methylase